MPVIMTRSDRIRIAIAAVGFAILGGLLTYAVWEWRAPSQRTDGPQSIAEIDLDPLRYTSPARSELSEDEQEEAVTLNAANPIVPGARITASPFFFDPALPPHERARAEHCLALAVYYEAATETAVGQRAVAQVVLNRVRHPAYPQTVCGVVFQGSSRSTGCQFTFTCDGALARTPSVAGWRRASAIAQQALAGYVEAAAGTATHYHTDWVAPVWRTELVKLAQIGTHIFYRWPGRSGTPAAFAMRYRGGEGAEFGALVQASAVDVSSSSDVAPAAVGVQPAAPVVIDNIVVPRPGPLAADTERSGLRADQERGTLTVGQGQPRAAP